jgi:hypothetical protein
MPTVDIDTQQVKFESVNDTTGLVIPVIIPLSDLQAWLDLYDPSSSSSPFAADSRVIARAVLDAAKAHEAG